ncbi:GTPase IMAP family member 8-like [Osmerus eperlanus]|uniref:GTPase IMAP family member 8-like n=1 Tax=Osmerus eperlanus TaxID=29151 RepID=UPI002E168929
MTSELRIVLLGGRYAGKSSSGNTILGREEFDLRTAAQCVKRQGEVAGRQVTVVDTPGWWRDLPVESTTELVKQEIVHSVSLCPPGPHTLLLVIWLDVSFLEEERRSIEGHLQLLSERVWSHTIVLFTCGDRLGDATIEQHIEREGKALQWLVEKCGNRYHVLNNKNRGDDTQVTELLDKMEEMVAGNRGNDFYQTSQLSMTRARSCPFFPPNMSGDSRAERDDGSGWISETGSEAGSLWSLEKRRDGRSDLLSLGSSGYGSQTSILSHHSSESNPHRSPHSRLNPEPAHSREPQGPASPLPVKRAGSYNFLPPNMSGDSRAERDDDSEAGSPLSLEERRDGRSDLLSLGSSGYGSLGSRLSHHSSGRTEHAQKGSAEEQLHSARLEFVERVTMPVLDDLLDGLLQERVINDAISNI